MEAKKQLGQNFLTDPNKINSIVNSIPNLEKSIIVEVGPGRGAITKLLVEKAKEVIAIEIDSDMIEILNNQIKSKNFTLINKDVLDISWNEILLNKTGDIQFVSNLPYYIATKIIFKVAYDNRFKSLSVMLQKELIVRIFAKMNTRSYGRLTVSIGSLFDLEKRIDVPAGCFTPKPNVDSGFIVLKKKEIDFDIDDYLNFIKHCFAMKRKTLLNSLKKSNFDKVENVLDYLNNNNIPLNIRSEQISIEMFKDIYKNII